MTQAFCRVIIIEALDNICHLGIVSVYYAASIGNGGTVSDLHLASLIDIGLYSISVCNYMSLFCIEPLSYMNSGRLRSHHSIDMSFQRLIDSSLASGIGAAKVSLN